MSTTSISCFTRLIPSRSGNGTSIREAEEYIVGWARELADDQPIKIVVHFPDNASQAKAAQDLEEAFHRYFAYRAGILQRDLKELFRVGRLSLAIGVPILVIMPDQFPPCLRLPDREPDQAVGRREFSDPRVGGKLAAAGDLPL